MSDGTGNIAMQLARTITSGAYSVGKSTAISLGAERMLTLRMTRPGLIGSAFVLLMILTHAHGIAVSSFLMFDLLLAIAVSSTMLTSSQMMLLIATDRNDMGEAKVVRTIEEGGLPCNTLSYLTIMSIVPLLISSMPQSIVASIGVLAFMSFLCHACCEPEDGLYAYEVECDGDRYIAYSTSWFDDGDDVGVTEIALKGKRIPMAYRVDDGITL